MKKAGLGKLNRVGLTLLFWVRAALVLFIMAYNRTGKFGVTNFDSLKMNSNVVDNGEEHRLNTFINGQN